MYDVVLYLPLLATKFNLIIEKNTQKLRLYISIKQALHVLYTVRCDLIGLCFFYRKLPFRHFLLFPAFFAIAFIIKCSVIMYINRLDSLLSIYLLHCSIIIFVQQDFQTTHQLILFQLTLWLRQFCNLCNDDWNLLNLKSYSLLILQKSLEIDLIKKANISIGIVKNEQCKIFFHFSSVPLKSSEVKKCDSGVKNRLKWTITWDCYLLWDCYHKTIINVSFFYLS